jgi:hypothetical protein
LHRYEHTLYEALRRHHHFQVAVLAGDLVEATLEFEGHIETSEEDDSLSRGRPMSPSGEKQVISIGAAGHARPWYRAGSSLPRGLPR